MKLVTGFLSFYTALRFAASEETVALELVEISTKVVPSQAIYDTIFVKFDPECLQHQNTTLIEHFQKALNQGTEPAKSLQSLSVPQTSKSATLPDATSFIKLLQSHLAQTSDIVSKGHHASRRRRQLSAVHRRLGDVSRETRETEILSALHLMAASQLVNEAQVPELLSLEEKGDWQQAITLIKNSSKVALSDEVLTKLQKKLQAAYPPDAAAATTSTNPLTTVTNYFKSMLSLRSTATTATETSNTTKSPVPILTDHVKLLKLDVSLIKNPFIGKSLLDLAKTLPCHASSPEPDMARQTLGQVVPAPPNSNSSSSNTRSLTATTSPRYFMKAPDDRYFGRQWYLKGALQGESYGAHIIDGWGMMLQQRHEASKSSTATESVVLDFKDLSQIDYGMTVAVLDSGCSRNADLVNQYWKNPDNSACQQSNVFYTTPTESDLGDCVGYDFGSGQPDSTIENAARIHGSSTAGLVAAQSANSLGITGVCPHCKIMCLKIYDDEHAAITLSSILEALDYIATKKVKISNHSYGGFGASSIEYKAHQDLAASGHLAVCSSGNNGCNLDGSDCAESTSSTTEIFTPAGYDIESIFSIGATTASGDKAWFSNYGSKSVDMFAPGDDIVTLFGESQLAAVKGTSFSAPIVAGAAAILWGMNPSMTAVEVKNKLMQSGTPVAKLESKAVSNRILSLSKALGVDYTKDSVPELLMAASSGQSEVLFSSLRGLSTLMMGYYCLTFV